MSAIGPADDDPIFEDEYQRARRRRMWAAGLTGNPEQLKVGDSPVHHRHVGTGITPKDAKVEPPEPRTADQQPRATLIRASKIAPSEVTRLRERPEGRARQESSRLEAAVAFLKRELAASPTSARVIYERGARVGLSERTVDRAKQEAQIGSKRFKTDLGMRWFWYLPGMEPSSLELRSLRPES